MRVAGQVLAEAVHAGGWPTEGEIATPEQLVDAVKMQSRWTRVWDVHKHRTRYIRGALMGEHVVVRTSRGEWQAIAFESEDAETLQAALACFGLLDRLNESYPAFLQGAADAAD